MFDLCYTSAILELVKGRKKNMTKLTFKHDSGDHELTDDWYLWINKKPTNHCISQVGHIYYVYLYDKYVDMLDTLKEAKEFMMEELGL